jgi:hypothetical protein
MIPAFQFPNWGWVAAILALPVVAWAGCSSWGRCAGYSLIRGDQCLFQTR